MNNPLIVLISGSRKGIGRYLAEHYLEQGAVVLGCSRSPSDLLHPRYTHFSLDIAEEIDINRMMAEIMSRHKKLDVLINNAAIGSYNHSLLTPGSTVNKVFATNVFGTIALCREAAKLMRRSSSRGRIVNFSSVAVPLHVEGEAAYAASKAAVESFTKIFAREVAEFSITVNAIGPTPIKTDLLQSIPQLKLDLLIQRQAIKRWGEMKDVAHLIDFLVNEESDFITGQTIYLGGVS